MSEDSDNEAPDRRARVRPKGQSLINAEPEEQDPDEEVPTPSDDEEAFFDENGDVLHSLPRWVVEAEKMYLSGKLPTIHAVAGRFDKSKSVVGTWCKRRRWVERAERNEQEAARKLEELIDRNAVNETVDLFAENDRLTLSIGSAVLRMAANHIGFEMRRQKEAMERGAAYQIVPFPKEYGKFIDDMRALKPTRKARDEAYEDFAALLNAVEKSAD